jgi:proline iminopeptidase
LPSDRSRPHALVAREEFVTLPSGVRLLTRTVGTGADVVVLHGGPGAHHEYLLPQYDALARGRRLHYYDQRGGGRSSVDRDVPVGWESHVADLDALIEHWHLSPTTLLGYSWGGLLALLFAITHRERVSRLALVSPAPTTAEGRREFERRFAERMASPFVAAERQRLQHSGLRSADPEQYRRRAFELSVAGYFKDYRNAADLTPFRVTERTQRAVWESLGDYDLSSELRTLNIPTTVLHGSADPIPIESTQHTAELLRGELVILDAGHAPHVEAFDRFVSTLDAFLPST